MAKIIKPVLLDETGQSIAEAIRTLAAARNLQVEEFPVAASTNVGEIYQYIGATNSNYTNGHFYKCIEENGTYVWAACDVQASEPEEFDSNQMDTLLSFL